MSLKSASHSPVLSQLGHLRVGVHCSAMDKIALPLLAGSSLFDRFVKIVFLIKPRIVRFWCLPVVIIMQYTPQLDQLAVLQTDSDIKRDTKDHPDRYD